MREFFKHVFRCLYPSTIHIREFFLTKIWNSSNTKKKCEWKLTFPKLFVVFEARTCRKTERTFFVFILFEFPVFISFTLQKTDLTLKSPNCSSTGFEKLGLAHLWMIYNPSQWMTQCLSLKYVSFIDIFVICTSDYEKMCCLYGIPGMPTENKCVWMTSIYEPSERPKRAHSGQTMNTLGF